MHGLQDFEKSAGVKQFKKACQWYESLGRRMAGSGHCLDVFACSLDQVGIAEMHDAVSVTGLPAAHACASSHVAVTVAGGLECTLWHATHVTMHAFRHVACTVKHCSSCRLNTVYSAW